MTSKASYLLSPGSRIRKTSSARQKAKELADLGSGFKLTTDHFINVAKQLWADLNTPRSLACALLLEAGEYAQLVNLKCIPRNYLWSDQDWGMPCGGRQFRDDYQATALLAKWPNFKHEDLDPVLACKKADDDAEQSCVATNKRLLSTLEDPSKGNSAYLHLIFEMQADIARVLGRFCPQSWLENMRFGPGKAAGQTGTCEYEKLTARPSATATFIDLAVGVISSSTAWLEAVSNSGTDPILPHSEVDGEEYKFDIAIEPGDRCTMVPKNAKTHRGIRAQPGVNVFAQLGIGNMMRARLLQAGLDLNDQVPNQQLAKLGSLLGRHEVTIDLKGASGHISRELVQILWEKAPRWLHAMNLSRTDRMLPHGAADTSDNWVPLASYSAMGNGFTFEMETLIFWAAVRAIRSKVQDTGPYRVYGDDIICSRSVADELIPFLAFLGFPLNADKTFLEGPFRESCGADYWHGTNVRPIHFSASAEEIEEANEHGTSIVRWVQVSNALRRLAFNRNHGLGCDAVLQPSWRFAVSRIPKSLRNSLKGPWSPIRDDYLVTSWADALTNPLVRQSSSLHCAVSPHLSVKSLEHSDTNFLPSKALLLWRNREQNRVTVRFDSTRSWLRQFLEKAEPHATPFQKRVNAWVGIKPEPGDIRPRRGLALRVGWEVFQPVGEDAEWRLAVL